MTPVLMLALALVQEAPRCSISGRVYNAQTNAPLARAAVHLGGRSVPNSNTAPSTVTDAGGNFHFDNLPADQYIAFAERSAFLPDSAPRLACGATDVAIKLTPQGMIYGKVIDDLGEPVSGAIVNVCRRTWLRGHRFLQGIRNATSQADGSFVVGDLPSGRYYLSTLGSEHAPPGEHFVENYYPDTPDPKAAAPVEVAAGASVRGVELRVRSARVFTVRGRITGDTSARGILMIHSSDEGSGSTNVDVIKGAFEFKGVAAGDYVLTAAFAASADAPVAFAPVTVSDADIDDLRVPFAPGITLTGSVRIDDQPFTLQAQIGLAPVALANTEIAGPVLNGGFTIKDLCPTRYRVMLENLPDGYYVKTMRFAGQTLSTPEIDAGAGNLLEIILSDKPATVSGTVRDQNDNAVGDAQVNLWSTKGQEALSARTSADGRYKFANLPPGDYRAIAWEWIENGAIENPALRAAFDSQAAQFTLDEGAQQSADLKPIPKAAVEATLARLP